ncbi:MAG TPA: hypothetical protein VMU94_09250 [Streptosporangiaceae bacterium]|nr:hypothetical protein [Streptosporangiaceae bacterium]
MRVLGDRHGSHGLLTACAAITSGECGSPATAGDIELLHAIPVNIAPRRQQPRGAESSAELGQGIAISAGRMRVIAWATAGEAAWSPAMTADSWQWAATGAAVVCHLSGRLLRSLGESPGQLAGDPRHASRLEATAEGAVEACSRWRSVAAKWYPMTTETQGLTGPGLADASDLVLRLGRLAFRDAGWTPASIRSAPLRDPADLALDEIGFTEVLAAVHYAADALCSVGDADLGAVSAAVRAGRVCVLTRTLPAGYDVPRRYANVVATDAFGLLAAYRAASDATATMVAHLDVLAVAVQAPSRVLSAARAATRVARRADVHDVAGDMPSTSDRTLNGWATSVLPPLGATGQAPPGPTEQELRRLHRFDPVLLLRAKAVDRAARMLIAEAKRGARQPAVPYLPHEAGKSARTERTAAHVAAENFVNEPLPMMPSNTTTPAAAPSRSTRAVRLLQ